MIRDFPNIKIVHIVRNPFSAYRDTERRPFLQTLNRYLITLNIYHSTVEMYAKMYPDNVRIFRYEDLVADKEIFMREVIVFHMEIDGFRWLVKTHQPYEMERSNLIKKINILTFLYPDLHFRRIDLHDGPFVRTYLLMDELTYPKSDPDMETAKRIVIGYSEKLKNYPRLKEISPDYNWQTMKHMGKDALNILYEKGFLSESTYCSVNTYFSSLDEGHYQDNIRLCHGDLGSKNIMMLGDRPIVIDWEDAFLAFPGYDELYWLTFFNHWKYYSKAIFNNTRNGKTVSIAVMLMILVLKSYLSYANNSYLKNSLSFEDRLFEMINLDK